MSGAMKKGDVLVRPLPLHQWARLGAPWAVARLAERSAEASEELGIAVVVTAAEDLRPGDVVIVTRASLAITSVEPEPYSGDPPKLRLSYRRSDTQAPGHLICGAAGLLFQAIETSTAGEAATS